MLGTLCTSAGDVLPIDRVALPPHLQAVQADCDSLRETINPDEWLLVDTSVTRFSGPGIYMGWSNRLLWRVGQGASPSKINLTCEHQPWRFLEGEYDINTPFLWRAICILAHEIRR